MGVVHAGGNWDGVYVGAFAGYSWGAVTDKDNFLATPETEFDTTGWQVGVAASVNLTVSEAIVAGLVADIAWPDLGGDFDVTTDWQGSIRGRLGFDGGAFLPYLTGGLAFANSTLTDNVAADSDTQTHIGWAVGAGVQFAVADNVSLDLLYRYSDYSSKDYDLAGVRKSFGLTAHTISAGLNLRF